MLELQKYLLSGKTPEDLTTEFGITVYYHPTLPLLGMKYSQIDSPKSNPIVQEARGIVLEQDSYRLIGRSFPRFFNLGEMPELVKDFTWETFRADSKVDGSLQIQFFYAGEWHVNTSGSFGLGLCGESGKTWRELFWSTLGKDPSVFDQFKHLTLVWELWTPWNKVVTTYPRSQVTLLGAFETFDFDSRELRPSTVDHIAAEIGVARPLTYDLKSVDEVTRFIKDQESIDITYEGLVLRDKNNLRIKVKSATYLALHSLKGNGNGFSPKNLVPLVLAGEISEICAVFPEIKPTIEETKVKMDAAWLTLESVWKQFHKIENQKEFAISVLKVTPFNSLLFTLRKQKGSAQTLEDLKFLWRDSSDLIVKVLFS